MRKSFVYLAAMAFVAIAATSCQKENVAQDGSQFYAIMENCGNNAKTSLSGTHVNWVEGDEVMIYGSDQAGLYSATPNTDDARSATLNVSTQPAQGRPYRAIYPASAAVSATSFSIPAVQESEDGNLASTFPMYAQSNDENLAFKNLCGVLKIHLQQTGATVSRIILTAAEEINGTFNIDNSGEEPAIAYAEGGTTTTTLICTTPQDISNGKDFYIYLPAGDYSGLNIKIQNAGYGVEKDAPADAVVTIERSKYSTLGFNSLNMPVPPDNGIWGLYSVSDNQQVWISSGNLQFKNVGSYTGVDNVSHTGTWRFAEHQYDHIGYAGHLGNVTGGNNSRSDSWIDLFGWGTSGYNAAAPLPRPAADALYNIIGDNDIAGTNYDWGVYVIGNGWRVMTADEWDYLFGGEKRTYKSGGATVCGVQGRVLIPDVWNGPSITSAFAYTSNVYTAEKWAEMESYGAVFMPITGYKSSANASIYISFDQGCYWTGSFAYNKSAYTSMFTNSGEAYGAANPRKFEGQLAVRLVKNYAPTSSK